MRARRGSGRSWLLVLLVAVLPSHFGASTASGQTARPGTVVRVTAPEHMERPCIGQVVTAGDPLVVRERDGTMRSIPLRQIELLESQRARSLRSREARLGGLAGALVGGVFGYANYRDDCAGSSDMFCFDVGPAVDTIVFASAGALIGGVLGSQFGPEVWRPVWKRGARANLGMDPDGVRLAVTLQVR